MALVPGLRSQNKLVLNLESTMAAALERNPALKIAEKEAAKAQAATWQAYAVVLPRVDGYAALQHAWEIQTSKIPNFLKPMLQPLAPIIPGLDQMPDFVDIAFGLENTVTYGATLTQPLFLGGAGWAGVSAAKAGVRAAEGNLEAMRQGTLLTSVRAFYGCLLARRILEVQEEALKQAQANLEQVSKKFDAGSASPFDKMRAEVEAARLEPEVISARNGYRSAVTQLKVFLALEEVVEVEPTGTLEYIEDTFGEMNLTELQRLALASRPEIRSVNERRNMAESGVTAARSDFFPRLVFQTDYSYLAMKDNLKLRQSDFSKGFTSSVSMQIPLFQGFGSKSRYEQAQLDLQMMMVAERQLLDGVRAEVEMTQDKFREAREGVLVARKVVDLATEALRLATVMYDEGANTQLDVLSSRLALTQAQLRYVNASFEYQLARYQLRQVTGRLTGVLE